ncbi:hypothetical protein [Actinomycetospora chibensis]|uniref:Uncharacterized protein n=1 Tax=Actinomycetospora chibensis TaxID=663606 RepID=A0ABV9RPB4_9PSEU|nr:hypothetical protein [Actinomycetospora chibensis]MDD7924301.1 hypothetical protein [Actinomycetospora chibensis]
MGAAVAILEFGEAGVGDRFQPAALDASLAPRPMVPKIVHLRLSCRTDQRS